MGYVEEMKCRPTSAQAGRQETGKSEVLTC